MPGSVGGGVPPLHVPLLDPYITADALGQLEKPVKVSTG